MSSTLDRHRERLRANPSDRRSFEALEETLYVGGEWAELASLYEARAAAPELAADAAERARILHRLGQLRAERQADPEGAAECWRAAVSAEPRYRPPLSDLRRYYSERFQWDVALQIAEAEVALPMATEEHGELLAEIGSIWLHQLGDPEQALRYFEGALQDCPRCDSALEGAARAHHALGTPEAAAALWERLVETRQGPPRARALVAWAGLMTGALGDPERAAELYRRALTDDPNDLDAIDALAARAESEQQWRLLADLEERRFELADTRHARAAAALSAGRVQLEHLGNVEAARLWLQRAAELEPDDRYVWATLADVERECGEDEALRAALERCIALAAGRVSVAHLLELASLRSEEGEDEAALDLLHHALAVAPRDALVIEALSDTLARLERYEELADMLEQRAALASGDPAAFVAALTELGALHEERLDDPDAALQVYERAFADDAAAPGVAEALERLHRKAEAWEPLRALLERAGRAGPEERRAGFLCGLGELLVDRFAEPGAAAAAFDEALALDPASPRAHAGLQRLARESGDDEALLRAIECEASVSADPVRVAALAAELTRRLVERDEIERALGWVRRWLGLAPEDVDALRAAADLHERLGHDRELRELLERLDPLLADGAEIAANRRRLGSLHSREGRRHEAIDALRSALDADPGDLAAHEALVEELSESGRSAELAEASWALVDVLPAARRAERLEALATLLEARLGDLPGAIDALRRLEECEGAPADTAERLSTLLERAGRFEELVEQLAGREAALAGDAPEVAGLALRRGTLLLEHLSRFDEAVEAYRRALALDPGLESARRDLERALRASGDIEGLVELLAERIARESDPDARARASLERAVILDDVLERSEEATAVYRELAFEAPGAHERSAASRRYAAVLERAGDWPRLREHLEAVLEVVGEQEREAIHDRLGHLCSDRLDDREAAIEHLEAAAGLAPGRPERWHALGVLYEQAGRPADLARVLEAELATATDTRREQAIRARVARLHAGELGDAERALEHYERLFEIDPGDSEAGEFLVGHFAGHGRLDEVARVLEQRLTSLDGQPRDDDGGWEAQRVSLRLRIAELRSRDLDDPDGAIAILEPALAEAGAVPAVAEPLAALYEGAGYTEDLVDLCRRASEACPGGAERGLWLARLGAALRELGSTAEAAEAYRDALAERPDDRDARYALRELYRQLGEAEPLARLLEAELGLLSGPAEIPLRVELAELMSTALGRPDAGFVHLRRVLQLEPGQREALVRALELGEEIERPDAVRELLDSALSRPQPPGLRAELLTRRARQALDAGDPGRAAEDYRESLSLDPGRQDVRSALRGALEASGDWEGVLDTHHQEAARAAAEDRPAVFQRAADIAWERIGPEAALPWLERLRSARPGIPAVLARIAEVHHLARRPRAQLRALEEQVALASDPRAVADLHVECAGLLERDLDAPARAAWALEQARRQVPDDVDVLRELDRLYRDLGRPRERAEVLERLVRETESNRVSLLCELAAIHAGPLAEPHRAAECLTDAVALTPRGSAMRGELLRALGEALQEAGPPDAWARCAEAELVALDPAAPVFAERRLTLQRELGLFYARSGLPDAALPHLRQVAAAGADAEVEAAVLCALRAQSNWLELERRLAEHLARVPGDLDGWVELARLREEKLCSPSGAASAWARACELDATRLDAVRGLRAAAERLERWEDVASSLEAELEHPDSVTPEQRSTLLRRLGDVAWERLQATTRASRSYAAAIEAHPEDFASHRSLERLLEGMEDWRGAVDLYESEIEVLGEREPERRQAVWLRAGEIARDHTHESRRALRAYVEAARVLPLPPERKLERAELHLACEEPEAFAEVFASWCDDPDSGARAADHLRLAEVLSELDRGGEALERAARAQAIDPEWLPAWDAAARWSEAEDDPEAAADALERAASLATGAEAARRLLDAAALRAPRDGERAASLLRSAAEADPASANALAALATLESERGAWAAAREAAALALELAEGADLDTATRLEAALVGGRAARAEDRHEDAARFFDAALELDPDHCEALAGAGEALAALGEFAAARDPLERRLDRSDSDPERALHCALLARCLREAGEREAALARAEEALTGDPACEAAHAECVALHEQADDLDAGIAALERWSAAREGALRAEPLLRAAEWELRALQADRRGRGRASGPGSWGAGRTESAEAHLRGALAADPACVRAGLWLARLLHEVERSEEVVAAAEAALEHAGEADERSELAIWRARALESLGRRAEAATSWSDAAEADPRCVEAAVSAARLLRGLGEWRDAAAALERFAERHPGDDRAGVAEVLHQLGRLLAGPLEEVDRAVEVYRRAVELAPDRVELRGTLAELLSHRPEDWREALDHHSAVLEQDPADVNALRAVIRVARQRERSAAVRDGLALLRALGAASPEECGDADDRLQVRIAGSEALEDPVGDRLRQAAQKVAREIGEALGAPQAPTSEDSGDGVRAFRAAALEAEARLTAPALLPLPEAELGEVLVCVATLALEADPVHASGTQLNALAAALGRRARRRARRALGEVALEQIAALDFAAWRSDVRALAAALAIDAGQSDLRTALVALVCAASERTPAELGSGADLSALIAEAPEARHLLRRAVRAWLAEV